MLLAELELDLEVFSGPFDLLLTLVLRDVVDLLELQLAEVVVAYLDHLEARGELDLEAATEFIVLVAALLELKSRLMLPGEEDELPEFEPGEAAEELLARMLEARRYRGPRPTPRGPPRRAAEVATARRRCPSASAAARSRTCVAAIWSPASLGRSIGGLWRAPEASTSATLGRPASPSATASPICAGCCAGPPRSTSTRPWRGRPDHRGGDAVRAARALQAGRGRAGRRRAVRPHHDPAAARVTGDNAERIGVRPLDQLARIVEALLFLSSEPVGRRELAEACEEPLDSVGAALADLRDAYAPGVARDVIRRSPVAYPRERSAGGVRGAAAAGQAAAGRVDAGPARDASIVAYLQPVSRPEIARIRGVDADSPVSSLLDRGLIEESGRSQFGAAVYRTTTLFLKLFGLQSTDGLPDVTEWDASPEEMETLRDRLLRAGEARASGAPRDGGGGL